MAVRLAPPPSRLHAASDGMQPSLTWPCFSDVMLMYRGVLVRWALALITASDTAPMAMLPWRIGSGGSAGRTGFSTRVSLRPRREAEGLFLQASLTAALAEDPAWMKENPKGDSPPPGLPGISRVVH